MQLRECSKCGKQVGETKDGDLRAHRDGGEYCSGGRMPKPKTLEEKAQRYIDSGRVSVQVNTPVEFVGKVQGSASDPYTVRLSEGLWTCDCESRIWRCAHVIVGQILHHQEPPHPTFKQRSLDEFLADEPLEETSLEDLLDG